MRRFTALLVVLSLVLVAFAPATAMAASPSPTNMLKEQVASQANIAKLLGVSGTSSTWINTIYFGKVSKTTYRATVPITVRTASGTTAKGVLVMRKYSGKWYFYSITAGSSYGPISNVAIPAGITTKSIASAISSQANHQYLISGILNGGYKKLSVLSRHTYSGAKQVNIRLSGGSRAATTGRIMAYRKTATNGTKYWFISSIR